MTLLVGPGTVVTAWEGPALRPGAGVAIADGRVLTVDAWGALESAFPDAERLDARGALVLPGLVNLHHHFYSALARAVDPGAGLTDFYEVLRRLWWRLDRALDRETVRVSARLALADSLRAGVTTVFDHHASPSCTEGSLEAIAACVEEAGLSSILCFETSDRNGTESARAALEENARFFRARRNGRIRGILGLHASFTLGDATLSAARELVEAGAGCHVHCAESDLDDVLSRRIASLSALERLDAAGLLGPRTLLAHGVHLSRAALERIAAARATLVHNPESNLHNGVGRLDPEAARSAGVTVGLGTDGLGSSVFSSLRSALLSLRDLRRHPAAGFGALLGLLATNARVAARFLDEPLLGTLVPGAPADLAVLAEIPPAPVTAGSLAAHLVYGSPAVRHTVARGRVLLRDFETTTIDAAALAEEARRLAPALAARFAALEPVPDRADLVSALTRPIPAMEGFA